MVTAAASERGVGSDPVTRAVPAPENAWTAPTVAGDPPPKTSARPWETAPAASCSGALSAPIRWAAPVAVRTAYMPLADVLADVSPPRTMSWPGGPGSTTSRLTGAAICHGSRPDSAAARVPGVPAARAGGGAARAGPVLRCAPVPCAPVLPLGRIANHATTATTVTASAAATVRLRRTATAACRLPDPPSPPFYSHSHPNYDILYPSPHISITSPSSQLVLPPFLPSPVPPPPPPPPPPRPRRAPRPRVCGRASPSRPAPRGRVPRHLPGYLRVTVPVRSACRRSVACPGLGWQGTRPRSRDSAQSRHRRSRRRGPGRRDPPYPYSSYASNRLIYPEAPARAVSLAAGSSRRT